MPKERPRCHPRRCPRDAHPACPPNVASLPAFEPAGGEEASVAEGKCISNSLLTLGAVITALTHAHGGGVGHAHTHVPFGDSVLTRLLKTSLGGNCKTTLVACVSAADADIKEALSTLRFAARAKCVRVHARVNAAVEVTTDRSNSAPRRLCSRAEPCQPLIPSTPYPPVDRCVQTSARPVQVTALAESLQMPRIAELERAHAELQSRYERADATVERACGAALASSRELEGERRRAAAEEAELRAQAAQAAAEAAHRETALLAELDELASRLEEVELEAKQNGNILFSLSHWQRAVRQPPSCSALLE